MYVIFLFLLNPVYADSSKDIISFEQLVWQLTGKNDDILRDRVFRDQASIQNDASYRFNIPNISAGVQQLNSDLSQTDGVQIQTGQEVASYNIGIAGELKQAGLKYSVSYAKDFQDQQSFLINPAISRSGESVDAQVSFNLLENAGFLIGRYPFEQRKLEYEVADSRYDLTLQQRIRDLVSLYLIVISLQEKLSVTKQIQEQAMKLNKSYRSLYQEGKVSRVDLLSSDIQLDQQKYSISSLELQMREAKRRLLYFVGGFSEEDVLREWKFKPISTKVFNIKKPLNIEGRLNSNPEIVNLSKQLELSNLEAKFFRNQVLPTLELKLGYRDSKNPYTQDLLTSLQTNIQGSYVGLNLTIPLHNIGARTDLSSKRIQRDIIETRKVLLAKSTKLFIEGLTTEIIQLEKQYNVIKDIEQKAEKRYSATLPLVKISTSARIDIFNFQNQLIETKYTLTDIKVAMVSKQADVLYAEGKLRDLAIKP